MSEKQHKNMNNVEWNVKCWQIFSQAKGSYINRKKPITITFQSLSFTVIFQAFTFLPT